MANPAQNNNAVQTHGCPPGTIWDSAWGMCADADLIELGDDIYEANNPEPAPRQQAGLAVPSWLWYVLAAGAGVGLAAALVKH